MVLCITIGLSLYFLDLIYDRPIASIVIYPHRDASATLDVPAIVGIGGPPARTHAISIRFFHKMSKGELQRLEAQISIRVAAGMPGGVVTSVGGPYGDYGFSMLFEGIGPTKLLINIMNPQEWPDKVEIEVQNNYFFL
jgi:hypothetical protein